MLKQQIWLLYLLKYITAPKTNRTDEKSISVRLTQAIKACLLQ